MKKILCFVLAISMIISVICLSSCDEFISALAGAVSEAMQETEYDSTGRVETKKEDETSLYEVTKENVIPFYKTPEISKYVLPSEKFVDSYEEQASKIIDNSIALAISYVNAMKDNRHSYVLDTFEEDANGYIAKLSNKDKAIYNQIVDAARKCESYTLTDKEYGGTLKSLYFALHEPLTYSSPDIACYFMIDAKLSLPMGASESYYSKIFDMYFDPYKDGNASVNNGYTTMKEVKDASILLDRVIKRVVRFMPEGLTTYDKYYYLACVLSEQVYYDARPDNCYTAFGALIGRKAVCEGYTSAYYLLCKEANLWCAYRNGLPEGQGHTWNMVKIDGKIYNVDVTWCDGYGDPYEMDWYECFIKSDDAFELDGHAATSGVKGTGVYEPCPYEK